MKDKKQRKAFRNFHFLIYFVIFLCIILFVYAVQSYQILSGSSVVVDEHGVLKKVTNTCGPAIFIPTKIAAEWSAFRSNKPGCVAVSDLASCNLPWGGTIPHGSSVTAYPSSSVPCGSSCSSQTRACNDGTLSGSYQYSGCSVIPLNGGWSAWSSWSSWSSCSVSCGGGTQTRSRSRSCTNPAPACGGADCSGPATETESQSCNTQSCVLSCSSVNSACLVGGGKYRLNAAGGGCGGGTACNSQGQVSGSCNDCPCGSC